MVIVFTLSGYGEILKSVSTSSSLIAMAKTSRTMLNNSGKSGHPRLVLEKWCWWTYFQGRNRNADVENGLVDTVGKEGGMKWGSRIDMYTTVSKIDSWWEAVV